MVVKVWKRFHVATLADISRMSEKDIDEFSVIGACKNPLHIRHARPDNEREEGYYDKKISPKDREYNFCYRWKNLYLNLVNSVNYSGINDIAIQEAMRHIDARVKKGDNILVVDKSGTSRAPSIILLWLIHAGYMDKKETVAEVLNGFKWKLYPDFSPSKGMLEYIERKWKERKTSYERQKEKGV